MSFNVILVFSLLFGDLNTKYEEHQNSEQKHTDEHKQPKEPIQIERHVVSRVFRLSRLELSSSLPLNNLSQEATIAATRRVVLP